MSSDQQCVTLKKKKAHMPGSKGTVPQGCRPAGVCASHRTMLHTQANLETRTMQQVR